VYEHRKHLKPIPEVGKKYHCFDDGKITFSRHYIVEVTEVLPYMAFKRKYQELFSQYMEVSRESYWLFSRSTDRFIVSKSGEDNGTAVFVRTKQGGWFSIGDWFNSGILDVTGGLWNNLVENADNFTWSSREEKERVIREGSI
jgi:hypothetical protein